jgi:hypothetical protein
MYEDLGSVEKSNLTSEPVGIGIKVSSPLVEGEKCLDPISF